MLAQEQGAKEMTTLMEASLQAWHQHTIAQGMRKNMRKGGQQGVQKGIQQGQADLLRRQAERRFDAGTARWLSALLASVEASRLVEVGDWIFECGSGDELLSRISGLLVDKRE